MLITGIKNVPMSSIRALCTWAELLELKAQSCRTPSSKPLPRVSPPLDFIERIKVCSIGIEGRFIAQRDAFLPLSGVSGTQTHCDVIRSDC